jgi:hypothetical protein
MSDESPPISFLLNLSPSLLTQLMATQRQQRLENQVLCYDGVVRKKVDHRKEDHVC